jgi:hypothetical protein
MASTSEVRLFDYLTATRMQICFTHSLLFLVSGNSHVANIFRQERFGKLNHSKVHIEGEFSLSLDRLTSPYQIQCLYNAEC